MSSSELEETLGMSLTSEVISSAFLVFNLLEGSEF